MVARSRAFQELVDELTAALGSGLVAAEDAAAVAGHVVHRRLRGLSRDLATAVRRGDALAEAVEGHLFGDLEQVELVMAWLAQRDVLADDAVAD